MNFNEVYNDKILILPKTLPKEKNYREFLADLFGKYILLLKTIDQKSINIKGLKHNPKLSDVIPIQENFIRGINETLEIYLDGQPAKAYMKLEEIINYRKHKYKSLLNINEFSIGENFYRIRKKEDNFPLTSLEMFHIPFEQRGKVATQRYSIPGFPSLYLSNTLYVAWEELLRPSLHNFQAVRLSSKKNIKFLDLTANNWGDNHYNSIAYKYLMTWPLIAACSIKVKNHEDTFKPEYIIPQLLLQWVRNTGEIDAIKYPSTHIEKAELIEKSLMYNLVLPVKDNKDSGYCKHLAGLFDITETISQQLLDYATGGGTFVYSKKEFEETNKKIPTLEIIKGRKYPYSYSVLGQMEHTLDTMDTKKIQ